VLAYGKGSTTIPILVVKFHNRSTAQSLRVGENPLNGKGLPLTGKAEGEEIVCSSWETMRMFMIKSVING
jgi:hypothetical protein